MERLSGIGVSPGVVVGRAVILTQRTEVMRFPIPHERVDREVRALRAARDLSRQQLQDIRARVARGPGSELAALFERLKFVLTGSNIETLKSHLFSGATTPAFYVVDAVRLSMSLPFGIFKPLVIRQDDALDAGVPS